jgi:hypothetical protein
MSRLMQARSIPLSVGSSLVGRPSIRAASRKAWTFAPRAILRPPVTDASRAIAN